VSEPIQPALTAEEWKLRLAGDHGLPPRTNGVPFIVPENDEDGLEVGVHVTYDSGWVSQRVPEAERHALAALALYDQEFGFTRADVAALRRDAKIVGEWRWTVANTHGGGDRAAFMDSLADRIEALLPPEKPT
jgi:hypothetical protein